MSAATVMGLILAHLWGDYIVQTDAMATRKTASWLWAIAHAVTYGLPFLLVTRSWLALLVIVATHAVIDRYRLARFVVMTKNRLTDWRGDFNTPTGYAASAPPWLAFWLLIIADNTLHLTINFAAARWL